MGKIKSAIITALLVAAIAVLAFFALFSWNVPGSNGVNRYNSFISYIHLGGDITGNAATVLYPEGVITVREYEENTPYIADGAIDEQRAEHEKKLAEYKEKYTKVGSLYVEKDFYEENTLGGLISKVKSDAEIISKRLGEKGYSAYSVSVQDELTIKVEVPTGFTYSQYKEYDVSGRSDATSAISRALGVLSYSGELSLRNATVGTGKYDLLTANEDISYLFTGISAYSMGGTHSVRVNLTDEGRSQFLNISNKIISADGDDKSINFYIGENQLIPLNLSEAIDSNSFYITTEAGYAQDYAIVLNSVINGECVQLGYNSADLDIVYMTANLGDGAALFLGCALLLIVVLAIVYSIVRYKRLGLVNMLMIFVYSLVMITAIMLLEIQLTVAGAFAAALGLALMCGSNFAVFEKIRGETKKGKTMQSSVKAGYKRMLSAILDLHIVLVVVALMLALISVGELAACGFIFFIATIASYLLYWFTRFIWYVISSPVKNKFAFCGFTRGEIIDD